MNVLPPCAYFIRQLLKRTLGSQPQGISDLLANDRAYPAGLEERLHVLYPHEDSYKAVILHLEKLVYSYQHAQGDRDQLALQDLTNQILGWLGYDMASLIAKPNILIVDDTIETIKLITTILTAEGYHVNSALNGQLALETVKTDVPKLILLDIQLPDIDGYQVYQHLQKVPQTANIPVIFLSGVETIAEAKLPKTEGICHLPKPFRPDDLVSTVRDFLKVDTSKTSFPITSSTLKLEKRREQALKILVQDHELFRIDNSLSSVVDFTYFFRATLDGRYLRVSQSFARLCGYPSTEAMISQVSNLWHQIYHDTAHQKHWGLCLQEPNQFQLLATRLKTLESELLDVVEQVCLVQDEYHHALFYEGYLKIA